MKEGFIPINGRKDLESIDSVTDLEQFRDEFGCEHELRTHSHIARRVAYTKPYEFPRAEIQIHCGGRTFEQMVYIIGLGRDPAGDPVFLGEDYLFFFTTKDHEPPKRFQDIRTDGAFVSRIKGYRDLSA